jgi:putative transposase
MRKRFTVPQIIKVLKESETGIDIQELCRKQGISRQTYYRWKSLYGGMEASEAERLKELEDENRKLKKLLAERDLEVDALKDVLSKKW